LTPRPLIFISAVSRELKSARQLVANTLTFLGYQPVWQDIFGTETGDLRVLLCQQIDQCKGVVQLVGQCYGAEPPTADEEFGRISYTQYEALYARKRGKKVWYLFIDEHFPGDACEVEPDEVRELQAAYRRRLQSETHVFHPLTSSEALEAGVLKLRDELTRLRRGVKQWAFTVIALLLVLVAASVWIVQGQRRQTGAIQKQNEQVSTIVDRYQKMQQALVRLADVEAQSKAPGSKASPEEQRANAYGLLERELGLPAGALAKELPGFALELYNRSDTTPLMRARAAYALGHFEEAERLSLEGAKQDRQGYEAAQRVQEDRRKQAIQGYELAGQSAQKRIQYAEALEHFREAEKLTDRERTPADWAEVQYAIADLLIDQGHYNDAENILRSVVLVRTRVLGPEHPDTLKSRGRLDGALWKEYKYTEADADSRALIKLEEKVLGPEHPDTLSARSVLANLLRDQDKFAEAEKEDAELIKLREKVLGPEHLDTLRSRNNLAAELNDQGRFSEAEAQYREIIKVREKVLGPEHPDTLFTRNNLAGVLDDQGKYAEAEAQDRELIKIEERVMGPEHPDTLWSRNNLGVALNDQGKYGEAEAEERALIKVLERVVGPEHPDTLLSRATLARALYGQGKYAEAEAEFREVIRLQEKALEPQHPQTLDSYYYFASGLKSQNKLQEAKEFARRAAEGARKVLGPNHPSTHKYEKLLAELETRK
jgi:tetratricopeptide (TPR) repeat protein